jgi:hypothetical protein
MDQTINNKINNIKNFYEKKKSIGSMSPQRKVKTDFVQKGENINKIIQVFQSQVEDRKIIFFKY